MRLHVFDSVANMEKKIICIISGGSVKVEFLKKFLNELFCENACPYVICVDGGLQYAYEAGIPVDEIVGDFDTISSEILEHYKEQNTPIRQFNPIKDSTDTDIALEVALSKKPECIYVLGGIGSRMDHTLGNIHILKKTLSSKVKTYLIDENNRISMIDSSIQIKKEETYGDYISFIPFTEKIENLSLRGFKYPLEDCTMVFGESLGISNEIVDMTAEVVLGKGILLVIESLD